ncbi:MAG: hypothetical protein PHV37_03465 [Candidatus Gastranaerophilales bacterium]|nr:hypothetical protein [Candidatus Gastranaerophilales bacterium]
MFKPEFLEYLVDKTGLDIILIGTLMEGSQDSYEVAKKIITECGIEKQKLGEIWGNYLGFAYVDPMNTLVDKQYVNKLGKEFILSNHVLPLCKFIRAVTIATSDPLNPYIQDKIEKRLDELVSFVFCFPFDIEEYLNKNY